jgi:UDPglucose--hexose-1-phosphate uridylyltransferase
VIAPGRARRPGASAAADIDLQTEDELASCPFCEGREERTPPETFALGPSGRPPNSPGWSVRVVPNLYPVFNRHEVVIATPRHVRSFDELTPQEIEGVAEAWSARSRAARADGYGYVHALLNEGREAGASLTHTHTQIAALAEPPPAVRAEEPRSGGCPVCAHLARERKGARAIEERDGLLVLAAYGGRLPYELAIAPLEHPSASAFDSELLPRALELLADAIGRVHAVEGQIPLNAWLHDAHHWHLELVPRLTVLAGIELGAGLYVNSLRPEDAAEALRAAAPAAAAR